VSAPIYEQLRALLEEVPEVPVMRAEFEFPDDDGEQEQT
jgi:hypothetical protein